MWAKQYMPGASRHVTTQIEALELRTLLSVTPNFVEVPISAAAIAAEPALADYRTFDLRVHLSAGDRWNIAGFEAVLSQGEFYRFENAGTTNPAIWAIHPQAEFATFVCVNDFGMPNSGLLPYVGAVGTTIHTATRFNVVWATIGGTPADANDFTIARLTVRNDAVGSLYGEVSSIQDPNTSTKIVVSLPIGAQAVGLARGVVVDNLNRIQPNVTVFEDVDDNGVLDAGEATAITSSLGSFHFIQPPGTHRYRALAPSGFAVVSPTGGVQLVTTTAGAWSAGLNFTIARVGTASISGAVREQLIIGGGQLMPVGGRTVFIDLNENGSINTNEPFAQTANDGTYTISSISAGSYVVRQVLPSGQAAVNGIVSQNVTLSEGQQLSGINFSTVNTQFAGIRGRVTRAGGNVGGVRVYVDSNNNGVFDPTENNAITNQLGVYEMLQAPGVQRISLVLGSGLVYESPASGQYTLTLVGGQLTDNVDFSIAFAPTFGRIGGTVSQPVNHVPAGTPTSLANWTVFLDADNDAKLDPNERRTITNSSGEYAFDNLAAGFHVVRVVKPNGWRYMSTSTDNHIISLATGQNVSGKNFVYTQRIMIAGVVFDDKNGNGTKDAGENGINGRRVWVDLNNNAMIDAGEPGGYLGSRGMFGFEDLVAGTYTVRAEAIAGWTNVGSGAATITLSAGKVKVNVPFGQQKIVLPRGATLPAPRNIGVLSPENDLTSVWSRL